jgi:hypothetical protein
MAVAFIQEFQIVDGDHSTRNYDHVVERLGVEADPPDGLVVHTAGFDDEAGVFRIFDVWETQEQGERFMRDRLMPILGDVFADDPNATPPLREGYYALHDVVGGRTPVPG